MSRTYKYPRTSLEDRFTRSESETEVETRMRKKLEKQKRAYQQRSKPPRLSKKAILFWNKQK